MNWIKWFWAFLFGGFLLFGVVGCKSAGEYIQEYGDASADFIDRLQESGAEYRADVYVPWNVDLSWSPFGFEGGIPGAYMRAYIGKGEIPQMPAETDVVITTGTVD